MVSGRTPGRIGILAALVLFTAACGPLREAISELPTLSRAELRFRPPQSSFIYAQDARLITTLHGVQNRTVVPLKKIPSYVRHAVIAVEDARFYEHDGVDPRAILRAAVRNASEGRIEEGGSTITQQYVKNAFIAPGGIADKSLARKIDEAILARQVENKLSKDEILYRYLNTVYFGRGAYGIQAAARAFFSKPASKLSLRQGALLAGLIRSPSAYDPLRNREVARERRDLVLSLMEEQGWISPERARSASSRGLGLQPAKDDERYPAPYFVDYVTRMIKYDPRFHKLGKTPQEREQKLLTGGLKIHTTVDLELQEMAEQAVTSVLPYPSDPHAALVSLEPETGYVRAMVGGRDWFASKKADPYAKFNLAISGEPMLGPKPDPESPRRAPGTGRQAGSAFKPFTLVAALEQGIPLSKTYPASACMDFPGADAGATWQVCNYGEESYSGNLSLLEATVRSVNVVFAQLILEVGPESAVEVARRMGITTPLRPVPSAVLGTNEVNPLNMASAYSTLAAQGTHHPPVAITEIKDPWGNVIYKDETQPQAAISPEAAYLTTVALQQVITRGTGVAASYVGYNAAGKTGTAQEYRDAWFAGYTPALSTAVWVGYPEGAISMMPSCVTSSFCKPTRTLVSGGSWPTQIWAQYMSQALAGTPVLDYPQPEGAVVTVTIDSRTGCLASPDTPPEYRVEATYAEGTQPTTTCPVEEPPQEQPPEEETGPPEQRGEPEKPPPGGNGEREEPPPGGEDSPQNG